MRVVVLSALLLISAPLQAQVVINEVLADNHFVLRDESDDSADWIELLNAGAQEVSLGGLFLSDAVVDEPWALPPVSLSPGEHLLVWCSGKDRSFASEEDLLRPGFPVAIASEPIASTAPWRYIAGARDDPGTPVPSGWQLPGFDDSGWKVGVAGFGYGVDDVRTELPFGTGVVLLRGVFVVQEVSERPLVLELSFDDGFAAFLNGELIAAANFPFQGELTFSSLATAQTVEVAPSRYVVARPQEILTRGKNVLSIALVNRRRVGPGSTDLFVAPRFGYSPRVFHADFRLDKGGEDLFLTNSRGVVVDHLRFPKQTEDHSFGRLPDGSSTLRYLGIPTPSRANRGPSAPNVFPETVQFDPPAGVYSGSVLVTLSADVPVTGASVHLTTDGEPPTVASPRLAGPVRVEKDTVLRAAVFVEGEQLTRTASSSYFVSDLARDLELPILSLSMAADDFVTVQTTENGDHRHERATFLEIFDAEGEIVAHTGAGMRLHGGAGRIGGFATKKSYRLAFRDIYGDRELAHQVIPETSADRFERLVLRSGYNDTFRSSGQASYVRDQLMRDLHADMGGHVSHGSWYNLFVNMEYRGVYNVVERMDEHFFATYFPEDGTAWDVVKQPGESLHGSATDWAEMVDFLFDSDLSNQELFDSSVEAIDLENFTSYMILNLWGHNNDWPHNNWYAAKPWRADGQWIFLSWDAERSLGLGPGDAGAQSFGRVLRSAGPSAFILRGLLRNVHYQRFFMDELDRHLSGALLTRNVVAHIDRLAKKLESDMRYETERLGGSVKQWQSNVEGLRRFARMRNPLMREATLTTAPLGAPRVFEIEPATIAPVEPVEVVLHGENFTENTTVSFSGLPSTGVLFDSSRAMRAVVPFDLEVAGFPAVTVRDRRRGSNTTGQLLEVRFARPRLDTLEPSEGRPQGGEDVTIRGADFRPGVRVEFGGRVAPGVELESPGRLRVTTPPGVGRVSVRVINTRPGDMASLNALEFVFLEEEFVRGDVDGSGRVDIVDAVRLVAMVAGGGPASAQSCGDALDADDSGRVELTDVLHILQHVFGRREHRLPAPYPGCGPDETPDRLICAGPVGCR